MADTLTTIKSTPLFTQQRVQLAWDTRVRSRLDSSTGLETANTAQQAIGLDSSPSDHYYPSQKLNRISDFRFVEQPSLEFQVLPFRIAWIMNITISRGRKIRGKTPIVWRENVRGRLECCRFEKVKWQRGTSSRRISRSFRSLRLPPATPSELLQCNEGNWN